MDLRDYFIESFERAIPMTRKSLENLRAGLRLVVDMNFDNATYIVDLKSLREKEGEKSASIEHTGKLEDAIRKAEQEYKTINQRGDIQARYSVRVKIGRAATHIPEEHWKSLTTIHAV